MRRVLNAQGASSNPPIHIKFGGPKCKGMKTRAKSSKKLICRVLNAQGTKCTGRVKYPPPPRIQNLGALSAKE